MLLLKEYHCGIAETQFLESDLDSNSSSATYYLWDLRKLLCNSGTWLSLSVNKEK